MLKFYILLNFDTNGRNPNRCGSEGIYEWNQTYVDHEAYEWKGSYTYPSIVGGSLHLQVGIISLLILRSRCNIPPKFPSSREIDGWI